MAKQNLGKWTIAKCKSFLETYKAPKIGLIKELQERCRFIVKLEKMNLEFIQSYLLPKVKGLCESFKINRIGNKAEILQCISKCIIENNTDFYHNIIDDLIKDQDKSDEINVMF